MVCTFFGHKDAPESIKNEIRDIITNLILTKNVNTFYVGNNGNFDLLVRNVLTELKSKHNIEYFVVLAYLPNEEADYDLHTLYPDGIETVPKRFAITYRNKWMIEKADYVVTYVNHSWGGAAQFKDLAEKKGKIVINIKGLKEA